MAIHPIFIISFCSILERDEFIRYFLGKGLRMKQSIEPYNTKAKAAGDIGNIEIVYGVS